MKYKYQQDYNKLSETCPPTDCSAQEINRVFRWVFDTITDERNFISQFHKNPKRFLNKDDYQKCTAMAFSMFNKLNGSKSRFQELKEIMGDSIYKTLGTKIAKGKITVNDGVNGKVERHGHFNHHSSTTANYLSIFKIMKEEL